MESNTTVMSAGNTAETVKTSYSKKELEEFREIILQKIEIAKKESTEFSLQISANVLNFEKTSFEDTQNFNQEQDYLINQRNRQETYIAQLKMALIRIKNGTYGYCKTTGKLIQKERLLLIPHATECVAIKKKKRGEM